jgi:hypothetical protein
LYSSLMIIFVASDTSLSRMCFFGTLLACCNHIINTLYAWTSLWPFLLVMGLTKITLLSISTKTMMYLLPRWDCMGNLPVWSKNTVSHTSCTHANTSHTSLPVSCDMFCFSRGDCDGCSHVVSLGLVDCTFFCV